MPNTNLDIDSRSTASNLDSIQQKLNQILATIRQIKAEGGLGNGVPSQYGNNGQSGGGVTNGAAGTTAIGAGPSLFGSLGTLGGISMFSDLMLTSILARSGMGMNQSGLPNASVMNSVLNTANPAIYSPAYDHLVGNSGVTLADSLYFSTRNINNPNVDQTQAPGFNNRAVAYSNAVNSVYQGAQGNRSVRAQMLLDPLTPLMPRDMYNHLGNLQQQGVDQRAQNVSDFRRLAIGGTALTLAGGLSTITNNTLSGELDPIGAAGYYAGSTAGAAAATTAFVMTSLEGNPSMALPNALQAGAAAYAPAAALAQAAIAGRVRTRDASIQIASVAASYGRDTLGLVTSQDHAGRSSLNNFADIADRVNNTDPRKTALIHAGLYTGWDYTSVPKLAEMYTSLGNASLAAGDSDIGLMGRSDQDYGMINRLAQRFGMAGPQAARSASNVLAIHNRYGDSRADLIFNGGIQDFNNYAIATGQNRVSDSERDAYRQDQVIGFATRRSAALSSGARSAFSAALLSAGDIDDVRASGDSLVGQTQGQARLARLRANNLKHAFGTTSEVYANADAEASEAELGVKQTQLANFDALNRRRDASNDDLPNVQLQGARERLQYLPFSAANPVRLSLAQLSLNRSQIQTISSDESRLQSMGLLTPERQLDFEQRRQGLLTQNAQSVATISEGMENRLPALSAGTPSFFSRYNSFQLAARNLEMMGSPVRAFGAINGSQKQMQDDFLRSAGGDPNELAPHSRTQDLNSDRSVALLERIANALERSTTSGVRPGERVGNPAASQSAGWNGSGFNTN